MDFKTIEKKWQDRWEKEKAFEANPDKRTKFFLNFPYPYMNAIPHIGHFYTLMRVEAFARYKRMKGFNVLFPQAWHCTGSPIISAAKRIEEGEEKQVKSLKEQGFSEEEIKNLKNPEQWTKVFPMIWKEAFKSMGISYDARRSFITTELNQYYDKFIRWQFNKLKEKGYIAKGEHPVVWDPKTNMPVGDHDRIEGEGEVPQEFILIKHKLDDGRFVISATLRQDTILGITNLFVHPDVEYVEIEINKEKWILSEAAVERLREQGRNFKVIGHVHGKEMIGQKTEEFGGYKVLILPATFLDLNFGTGLVHSVPSDSADDLIAIKDLQKDKEKMREYGLNVNEVQSIIPIPVLDTPGYGENPAQKMLEKYNVESQNERAKLEKIKKELYKISYYTATFNDRYKKGFSKDLYGLKVDEGKDIIKNELIEKGWADVYYQLTGKVVSRSLADCIVKIVKDQWFIQYGNKKWKKQVHNALKNVKLYPETVREQFSYVIDWLNNWACTREFGMGTRLPFDEKWLIESLSDSTVYLAYYTIAHLIEKVPIEYINDAFFDYVFLDSSKKPDLEDIDRFKEEFEYWYPVDFRNSGKDLVQNHLTFFLFNHVALFPEKFWPKGIGVNGWVKVDGQKMSKSLGNMIPLNKMCKKYGADASRLTILNGGEELVDPNWDSSFAEIIGKRLNQFYDLVVENYGKGRTDVRKIDLWMENELNRIIQNTERFMDETLFRSAIQSSYFDLQSKLKWYMRRVEKPNKETINRVIEVQLLMLSPFTPFICEELWERIGKKEFIFLEKWPGIKKIDYDGNEEMIKNVLEDIKSILKLVKFIPEKVFLYSIPGEYVDLNEAKQFLEEEIKLKFEIYKSNDANKYDPKNKAGKAKKGKVAIYLE